MLRRYRHGSDRLRYPPLPQRHQAGLLPEAEHGADRVRADPSLRAVRGDISHRQQGVHARRAERRARVPDRIPAAHAHHSLQLQARAGHRAGEFTGETKSDSTFLQFTVKAA